jgi:hypothetical protein
MGLASGVFGLCLNTICNLLLVGTPFVVVMQKVFFDLCDHRVYSMYLFLVFGAQNQGFKIKINVM